MDFDFAAWNVPALQVLGKTLLHSLWEGALIAAALYGALKLLGSASSRSRYALACVSLLAMLAAPVATFALLYGSAPQQAFEPSPALTTLGERTGATSAGPMALDAPPPVQPDSANAFLGALVMVWLVGVALSSLRLMTDSVRLRALLRSAEPAPEAWQIRVDRLARRMGMFRMVTLVQSTRVTAPCAAGLLRPIVIAPVSLLTAMPPATLELILAHELAHLRRHDFLVNLLQRVAETLLFFHPAAHWVSRVIRTEREHCCDDEAVAVTGSSLAYARALTELASMKAGVPAGAMSSAGGSLTDRIRRLVLPARGGGILSVQLVSGVATLLLASTVAVAAPYSVFRMAKPPLGAIVPIEEAPIGTLEEPPVVSPMSGLSVVPSVAPAATPPAASEPKALEKKPEREREKAREMEREAEKEREKAREKAREARQEEREKARDARREQRDKEREQREERRERRELEVDRLTKMRVAGVDDDYRKAMKAVGVDANLDELIELRIAGVTPDYAKQMRGQFPAVDIETLVELSVLKVEPVVIGSLRAAGFTDLDPGDIAHAQAVGASPDYVASMRAAGLSSNDLEDLAQLRAVGVTPEYVKAMKAAGIEVEDIDTVTQLRAVGVTPEYVQGMASAGVDIDSVDELTGLRAVGVTPEYLQEMRAAGIRMDDADEVTSLRALGTTPEYVQGLRQAGVEVTDPDDLNGLRALGVTPKFVAELKEAGYSDLSAETLTQFRAVGVDGAFIRSLRAEGLENLSADDVVELKVMGVTPDFVRDAKRLDRER